MRRRICGSARAFALVAVALLPVTPVEAAPPRPPCLDVAVSPDFARDRTAVCGRLYYDGSTMVAEIYRTRDGGTTWAKARAAGLVVDQTGSFAIRPQFSPDYRSDKRIFLATTTGMYATTDAGDTFLVVDSALRASGLDNPAVYAGDPGATGAVLGKRRLMAAVAAGASSARTDVSTGTHQPVIGAGAQTALFVLPTPIAPSAQPLALTTERADPSRPDVVSVLWSCTNDLACSERRYVFPDGFRPVRFWWLPVAKGRAELAVLLGRGSSYRVMLSADNGVTFRRWTSLERIIEPAARAAGSKSSPAVGIAFDRALPGRVYARIVGTIPLESTTWPRSAPPAEQIFRSDDGGASWRRVAYGLGFRQGGRAGTIPWNVAGPGVQMDRAPIVLASDGRLLIPGAKEGESGFVPGTWSVYCSRDGGNRWYVTCPK
jgi:hypothetical protein